LSSHPQAFFNGEIHCRYNFVLGFSHKLVASMMDKLDVQEDQIVLDAFCGTGTTLVESTTRVALASHALLTSQNEPHAVRRALMSLLLVDVGIRSEKNSLPSS
jgi:putative RNA methylase family UPF0020